MSDIVVVFDTSYSSLNLGDFIIMEAINNVLNNIVKDPEIFILRIPTHINILKNYYKMVKNAKLKILCGTNLLHLNYLPFSKFNSWKINQSNLHILHNTLLFGVGTNMYIPHSLKGRVALNLEKPYSEFMWRKILLDDNNIYHSVRDTESVNILKKIGLNNVLNTGCPTIWKLDEEHCSYIPKVKSESVVITFTDYRKHIIHDRKMLQIIAKHYKNIYIWPQGSGDYDYIRQLLTLTYVNVKILPATLKAFDNLLSYNNIDYIGTRLHGGIRALQHRKRSIIIAVDNRALGFGRDFNIPIVRREKISEVLEEKIQESFVTHIKINKYEVDLFKNSLEEYINSSK